MAHEAILSILPVLHTHLPSAHYMDVQVVNCLASMGPIIDDKAGTAPLEPLGLCNCTGPVHKAPDKSLIAVFHGQEALEMTLGHDEYVNGGLRVDVANGENLFILEHLA